MADWRRLRVLVICHTYYEDDSRVRREAESLVARGHDVEVLALRRPGLAAEQWLGGVHLVRLGGQHRQGRSFVGYLGEYTAFSVRAFWAVLRRLTAGFDLVQVHTLPDTLVLSALPLKLAGLPVILDMHEAMPAFFAVRFDRVRNPVVGSAVRLAERIAISVADDIITVNDALRDRLLALGVHPQRINVVLNAPDLTRFDRARHVERAFMADGELRVVYAGSLTPLYELEVIIRALAELGSAASVSFPVRLDVIGGGDAEPLLRSLAVQLGLGNDISFHGRLPIDDVPRAIAAADVGVAPTRRDPYTVMSVSTKLFEYAAMGKPVVASRLPTVVRYLGEDALAYYEPGEAMSAAAAIRRLVAEPVWRGGLVAAASGRIAAWTWESQGTEYVSLVERVARR